MSLAWINKISYGCLVDLLCLDACCPYALNDVLFGLLVENRHAEVVVLHASLAEVIRAEPDSLPVPDEVLDVPGSKPEEQHLAAVLHLHHGPDQWNTAQTMKPIRATSASGKPDSLAIISCGIGSASTFICPSCLDRSCQASPACPGSARHQRAAHSCTERRAAGSRAPDPVARSCRPPLRGGR